MERPSGTSEVSPGGGSTGWVPRGTSDAVQEGLLSKIGKIMASDKHPVCNHIAAEDRSSVARVEVT